MLRKIEVLHSPRLLRIFRHGDDTGIEPEGPLLWATGMPILRAQHFCDEERKFQRLLGIQAWSHRGFVTSKFKVGLRNVLGATETLGNLFTRAIDVDPTRMGAH